MEDVVTARILMIRKQIEKLVDEVFNLIEMERELTDRYIKFMRCKKSCGSIYSDY